MRSRHETILAGAILACLALAVGCGSLDQGPAATDSGTLEGARLAGEQTLVSPGEGIAGGKGFVPLDIGDRWTYAGELAVTIEGEPPSVTESHEEHTIIGSEERFGRDYILERQQTMDEDGDTLSVYWLRYRQDRSGLYEADIPISDPPIARVARRSQVSGAEDARARALTSLWRRSAASARTDNIDAYRAGWERLLRKLDTVDRSLRRITTGGPTVSGRPGGVLPDEITRLHYPLRPSQEWTVRDDPFFVGCTVESHDVLDLPPGNLSGWKIELTNAYLGPNDLVYLWYGRDGFLGQSTHLEQEVTDLGGNPVGTVIFEETLFLEDFDLVGRGR